VNDVLDTAVRFGAGLLPPRTLCLTFDDGPGATLGLGRGPRTLDLAEYLAEQGIEATFFMCGKHIEQHPDVPRQVLDLGHTVGNHTYEHRLLPSLSDDEVRYEIRSTRELLARLGVSGAIPFRAPWGEWDDRIAAAVSADTEIVESHSAVYGWDIDAEDWECWDKQRSAQHCADAYLALAKEHDSGVVLMHDSTADPGLPGERMRAGNLSLDAVRLLVPMLRAEGFTFLPLSAVDPA